MNTGYLTLNWRRSSHIWIELCTFQWYKNSKWLLRKLRFSSLITLTSKFACHMAHSSPEDGHETSLRFISCSTPGSSVLAQIVGSQRLFLLHFFVQIIECGNVWMMCFSLSLGRACLPSLRLYELGNFPLKGYFIPDVDQQISHCPTCYLDYRIPRIRRWCPPPPTSSIREQCASQISVRPPRFLCALTNYVRTHHFGALLTLYS